MLPGKFKISYLIIHFRAQYFDPGSEHRLVVGGASVGNLKGAMLEWSQEITLFNPLSWRIHGSTVSIKSITIDCLETGDR